MNYENILCDANNLYRAYKASVKGSKWKESTQKFMMNHLRYIFDIQDDILNRTLQNGATGEFILHERGRIRPITSLNRRGISHSRKRFEVHLRKYYINEKKTRIVKISGTYKYLQVKYTLTETGKIVKRINPKRVTTMRRKLKKLSVKVKNGEAVYENVENMFKGWMGSFYKILSKQQRRNLINLYEKLFDKSITVVNKKMIIVDTIT